MSPAFRCATRRNKSAPLRGGLFPACRCATNIIIRVSLFCVAKLVVLNTHHSSSTGIQVVVSSSRQSARRCTNLNHFAILKKSSAVQNNQRQKLICFHRSLFSVDSYHNHTFSFFIIVFGSCTVTIFDAWNSADRTQKGVLSSHVKSNEASSQSILLRIMYQYQLCIILLTNNMKMLRPGLRPGLVFVPPPCRGSAKCNT
jgi:hypothetical protein